ncbi:MAG: hypothetical protein IPG99_12365 [Ignavibacteria bacterium]|nr:hypothetical protein [Ignavibacteria bacterium]
MQRSLDSEWILRFAQDRPWSGAQDDKCVVGKLKVNALKQTPYLSCPARQNGPSLAQDDKSRVHRQVTSWWPDKNHYKPLLPRGATSLLTST